MRKRSTCAWWRGYNYDQVQDVGGSEVYALAAVGQNLLIAFTDGTHITVTRDQTLVQDGERIKGVDSDEWVAAITRRSHRETA